MSKKILIVEDNDDDLLIVKRYLNKAGYTDLVSAKNVAEGVKKAISEKPDIVIADTVLPDGDGFEICRKVREAYGKGSPKVIIMTGFIDAIDTVRARKVGADDYCAKVSDCAPLLAAVKKLI